ncbi:hypothetical protein V8F20_010626 [Naviculisporaceae sp. PSN 640]
MSENNNNNSIDKGTRKYKDSYTDEEVARARALMADMGDEDEEDDLTLTSSKWYQRKTTIKWKKQNIVEVHPSKVEIKPVRSKGGAVESFDNNVRDDNVSAGVTPFASHGVSATGEADVIGYADLDILEEVHRDLSRKMNNLAPPYASYGVSATGEAMVHACGDQDFLDEVHREFRKRNNLARSVPLHVVVSTWPLDCPEGARPQVREERELTNPSLEHLQSANAAEDDNGKGGPGSGQSSKEQHGRGTRDAQPHHGGGGRGEQGSGQGSDEHHGCGGREWRRGQAAQKHPALRRREKKIAKRIESLKQERALEQARQRAQDLMVDMWSVREGGKKPDDAQTPDATHKACP